MIAGGTRARDRRSAGCSDAYAEPDAWYGLDVRDSWSMESLMTDAAVVVKTFAGIVKSLRVDRERALAELNAEWTCTQEIADTLMREAGIDFRTGHGFASRFVTYAREKGLTPANATYGDFTGVWSEFAAGKDLPQSFPLNDGQLKQAVNPLHILDNRKTPGSASPLMLEDQMNAASQMVRAMKGRGRLFHSEPKRSGKNARIGITGSLISGLSKGEKEHERRNDAAARKTPMVDSRGHRSD